MLRKAPRPGAYCFFRPFDCVTQFIGEKVGLIIIGLVKETTLMASALCNKEYQRKRILRALVLHLKQQA